MVVSSRATQLAMARTVAAPLEVGVALLDAAVVVFVMPAAVNMAATDSARRAQSVLLSMWQEHPQWCRVRNYCTEVAQRSQNRVPHPDPHVARNPSAFAHKTS